MKRRTPLQVIMADVKCTSLANGWIRVEPVWRDLKWYDTAEGGGPGTFVRMRASAQLEKVIRRELKR